MALALEQILIEAAAKKSIFVTTKSSTLKKLKSIIAGAQKIKGFANQQTTKTDQPTPTTNASAKKATPDKIVKSPEPAPAKTASQSPADSALDKTNNFAPNAMKTGD